MMAVPGKTAGLEKGKRCRDAQGPESADAPVSESRRRLDRDRWFAVVVVFYVAPLNAGVFFQLALGGVEGIA